MIMSLSREQISDFQTNGYVIAENIFSDTDLQPLIDEIEQMIDERARVLYEEGKLLDLHENEPFERRFALLHSQCPEINRSFDIMHLLGNAMFEFLRNDKLVDVVESL